MQASLAASGAAQPVPSGARRQRARADAILPPDRLNSCRPAPLLRLPSTPFLVPSFRVTGGAKGAVGRTRRPGHPTAPPPRLSASGQALRTTGLRFSLITHMLLRGEREVRGFCPFPSPGCGESARREKAVKNLCSAFRTPGKSRSVRRLRPEPCTRSKPSSFGESL